MSRILVVDDEKGVCDFLQVMLNKEGHKVYTSQDPTKVVKILQDWMPEIILLDLRMPELDGLSLLSQIKKLDPAAIVILITAYASFESVVEAMRRGAFDYIAKPFKLEEIRWVIHRAIETHLLKQENIKLQNEITSLKITEKLVGSSKAFQNVLDLVRKVALTDSTIIIQGESGTGKELVAREIHRLSKRAKNAFIPVNCGALTETLLESELFGYVKGSFTGATRDKDGLFKTAHLGTLFLDEISSASQKIQVGLLRVLEQHEITPVGSTRSIPVDVRLLAATNKDLERLVQQGEFREDLYYRINVIPVQIPPLRDRKGDIPLLIHHFLKKCSAKHKIPLKKFSSEATRLLLSYNWPGNIRELENTIEREIILTESSIIDVPDLPDKIKEFTPSILPPISDHPTIRQLGHPTIGPSDYPTINLSDRQKQILNYLHSNPKITSRICSSLFNISQRMIRNDLQALANKKLITRKGTSKKNTYYTLTET